MRGKYRFIICCLLLAGCRHAAMRDVRAIVDQERALLALDRGVIRIPEVDLYLQELGCKVLNAVQNLDNTAQKRSKTLDIYDRFDVVLLHSLTPNAWVWGDDFACITTRLFLDLDSPEELVAVLAHEYGHIQEMHAVEREERKYAAQARFILLCALAGAVAGYSGDSTLTRTVFNNAEILLNNYQKYKKADEYEADDVGLRIYRHLRLDSDKFDDFFERAVRQYCNYGGGTHPLTQDRISRIRNRMADYKQTSGFKPMDLRRLKLLQRSVALTIVKRAQEGALFGTEWERARLASSGYAVHPAFGCGPFFVDSDVLANDLVAVLRKRITMQ